MPEALNAADKELFLLINGFVGVVPFVDRIAHWVVSDYLMPIALALSLIFMWFVDRDREIRTQRQIGVFVALTSMALSNSVVFMLNFFYFRPRPFVNDDVAMLFYKPTDSSFPSNAVAAVFGLAFGIWGVNRRLGWVAILAASLYGLARVYCRRPLPAGHPGRSRHRGCCHVPGLQAARSADATAYAGDQASANSQAGVTWQDP